MIEQYRKHPSWAGQAMAPMELQDSIRRMSTNYGVYPPRMRWSPSDLQARQGSQAINYPRYLTRGVLEPVDWPRTPFQPAGPGLAGGVQDVLSGCPCMQDGAPPPHWGYRRDETYRTAMGVAGIAAATFLLYKAFIDRPRRAVAAPQIV